MQFIISYAKKSVTNGFKNSVIVKMWNETLKNFTGKMLSKIALITFQLH